MKTILLFFLLANSAFVFSAKNRSLTSLIRSRSYAVATAAIERGANVNEKGVGGETPLIAAASLGNIEIINLLLSRGAKVNAQDAQGNTAFMKACKSGQLETAKILVDAKADIKVVNKAGGSAIYSAAKHDSPEMLQFLLAAGAKPRPHPKALSALENAIFSANRVTHVKLLREAGADLNTKTSQGVSLRTLAASYEYKDLVDYLAANGVADDFPLHSDLSLNQGQGLAGILPTLPKVKINAVNHAGETPLSLALEKQLHEPAKLLITQGADANKITGNKDYPLTIAIRKSDSEMVGFLLANGAKCDVTDKDGLSAIVGIAGAGDVTQLENCVASAPNILKKKKYSSPPLIAAARMGQLEAVKWLVAKGVNLLEREGNIRLALHVAAGSGKNDVVSFLLDNKFPIDILDGEKNPAIAHAICAKHSETVRLLLEKGARMKVKGAGEPLCGGQTYTQISKSPEMWPIIKPALQKQSQQEGGP